MVETRNGGITKPTSANIDLTVKEAAVASAGFAGVAVGGFLWLGKVLIISLKELPLNQL